MNEIDDVPWILALPVFDDILDNLVCFSTNYQCIKSEIHVCKVFDEYFPFFQNLSNISYIRFQLILCFILILELTLVKKTSPVYLSDSFLRFIKQTFKFIDSFRFFFWVDFWDIFYALVFIFKEAVNNS